MLGVLADAGSDLPWVLHELLAASRQLTSVERGETPLEEAPLGRMAHQRQRPP